MKKFFVIAFAATMFFTGQANAQVKAGIKAGLNLTSMSLSEKMFSSENRAGFFVGPTVNFTLPVVGLALDASLLYDQRSAKVLDETLKQQSIQIPINVRYGFGLGNTASVYIFAGPQFGFAIGDKVTELANDAADWRLKDSNLSANVGLGLMLLNHLQISANYNIALGTTGEVDVNNAVNTAWNTAIGKAKANAWQLSVAYFF